MSNINPLNPPPGVQHASKATEVVRVWIVDKRIQFRIAGNLWEDAAVWGMLLVDLARHVSKAYEDQGGMPAP